MRNAGIALLIAFAALSAIGVYWGKTDKFCEPMRIARVIELGCR